MMITQPECPFHGPASLSTPFLNDQASHQTPSHLDEGRILWPQPDILMQLHQESFLRFLRRRADTISSATVVAGSISDHRPNRITTIKCIG